MSVPVIAFIASPSVRTMDEKQFEIIEKIFKEGVSEKRIVFAVVSLIAVPVISMAKKARLGKWRLLLAAATASLIIFAKMSPVYIMLAVFVYFFVTYGFQTMHHRHKDEKGGEQ